MEIPAIVNQVTSLLGPQAEQASVTLAAEGSDAPRGLSIDPEQIQQVLVNIVLNAVQASPRGGRVLVRYGPDGERYRVEVSDQGGGIPADVRGRIFEPFFTTKERGTGLGLAISQRIVAAHQGDIRISSQEGKGTTVEIVLPLPPLA